jgi:hypothetical protein
MPGDSNHPYFISPLMHLRISGKDQSSQLSFRHFIIASNVDFYSRMTVEVLFALLASCPEPPTTTIFLNLDAVKDKWQGSIIPTVFRASTPWKQPQ